MANGIFATGGMNIKPTMESAKNEMQMIIKIIEEDILSKMINGGTAITKKPK